MNEKGQRERERDDTLKQRKKNRCEVIKQRNREYTTALIVNTHAHTKKALKTTPMRQWFI